MILLHYSPDRLPSVMKLLPVFILLSNSDAK
jgi:hypothetical protein